MAKFAKKSYGYMGKGTKAPKPGGRVVKGGGKGGKSYVGKRPTKGCGGFKVPGDDTHR